MNRETIEAQARQYAEELIAVWEQEKTIPTELKAVASMLIQNYFVIGAMTTLKSLVEMPLDKRLRELAEYARDCDNYGKEEAL